MSDRCPRSMGFSPCGSAFSPKTRAEAHALFDSRTKRLSKNEKAADNPGRVTGGINRPGGDDWGDPEPSTQALGSF